MNSALLTEAEFTVTLEPLALKVAVIFLLVPTITLPKAKLVGETANVPAAAPLPVNVMAGKVFEALETTAILPVALPEDAHRRLLQSPGAEVTVDLEALQVTLPGGGAAAFSLPPFARHCLLQGLDELTFLLSHEPLIADYERAAFPREVVP